MQAVSVTKVVKRTVATVAAAIVGVTGAGLCQPRLVAAALPSMPGPVASAGISLPSTVAYVRDGNIFVSTGAAERRLTSEGGHSRPRWSPDGSRLAFLRGGRLWTMKPDGSARRRLTTRAAAGPSWSPDGRWIAFASLGCTGGPVVYRISARTVGAKPQVLFPSDCRGEPLPAEPAITAGPTGPLTDRLRHDDAVAWAPDGATVAFRGGQCESIYDSCLSIGTIATGGERTVTAFGGGSLQTSGFAVVPSWRADGARLSFTSYRIGETAAENLPVHLEEYNPATGTTRIVGRAQDREMVYLDAGRGVATAQHRGGSWVMVLNLRTGARTALHPGSQPSVRPAGVQKSA